MFKLLNVQVQVTEKESASLKTISADIIKLDLVTDLVRNIYVYRENRYDKLIEGYVILIIPCLS